MMVRFYSYFFFLGFSTSFYVGSYTLADIKNNLLNNGIWETREFQTGQHELDSNRKHQGDLSDFENKNQIAKADTFAEGNGGKRKWSSVLTFDRLKNLTEKEDHLTIYENDDDDDETGIQDSDEHRFGLLSPEGFLPRIHSSEETGLERTKRQAEGGKKKCKCRRKGRRGMRRRRRRRRGRRRRTGQTRPARRPRKGRRRGRRRGAGRRGRRRCVCRRKEGDEGDGEGEGKGEEDPEVEEEESTTTEGGGSNNEDGEEGEGKDEGDEGGEGEEGDEGDDGDEEEEEGENEDSDDEEDTSDDESDEKKGSEEGSVKNTNDKKEIPVGGINHEKPVYVMYPGTAGAYGATPNAAGAPVYTTYPIPFSPYPYYTGPQSTLHGKSV